MQVNRIDDKMRLRIKSEMRNHAMDVSRSFVEAALQNGQIMVDSAPTLYMQLADKLLGLLEAKQQEVEKEVLSGTEPKPADNTAAVTVSAPA